MAGVRVPFHTHQTGGFPARDIGRLGQGGACLLPFQVAAIDGLEGLAIAVRRSLATLMRIAEGAQVNVGDPRRGQSPGQSLLGELRVP